MDIVDRLNEYTGMRSEEAQLMVEAAAEITRLREAIRKALKHANANGMQDWPSFKGLRAALGEDKP